jgi:hypothetical protein
LLSAVAAAPGASGGADALGLGLLGGLAIAVPLLALLPLALMMHAWRPAMVERVAHAHARRGTAALLIGAGTLLALLVLAGVLQKHKAGAVVAPLFALSVAWATVGLAGCSRRLGVRLADREIAPGRPGPLVIGWLVRCGAVAAPVLWPITAIYVVCTALGAPTVALFERNAER